MSEIKVFNVLGDSVSTIKLDKELFDIKPHNQSMFDLVLSERASIRQGTHKVKTRSEVRGGGKKPWKQKHTGRARAGTSRSPIWRGGGIIFGPQVDRNYELKVNKKVKKLALKSGWSQKNQQNSLVILDKLEFVNPSSKDFFKILENNKINEKKVMFIIDDSDQSYNLWLSSRNIANVLTTFWDDIYLDDLLYSDAILMTQDVLKKVEGGLK